MTGACEGAASGAGIRFWKAGIRGACDPKRVVGLRTKPPRFANPPPCPPPPRAKPGVAATTQAAATNTATKTRFMIVVPHFAPPLDAVESNHPRRTTFNLRCLALTGLALIRTLMCYTNDHWLRPIHIVMAGLVPAIHVFDVAWFVRRGCPRQARA
jgi:hypothetical protein